MHPYFSANHPQGPHPLPSNVLIRWSWQFDSVVYIQSHSYLRALFMHYDPLFEIVLLCAAGHEQSPRASYVPLSCVPSHACSDQASALRFPLREIQSPTQYLLFDSVVLFFPLFSIVLRYSTALHQFRPRHGSYCHINAHILLQCTWSVLVCRPAVMSQRANLAFHRS